MIEKVFNYSTADTKVIERVIADDNLNFNHMILNKGESLPMHFSNSNVYMTIVRGTLSIGLDEQEVHIYSRGNILVIPKGKKMNVFNDNNQTLELFVVKVPAP